MVWLFVFLIKYGVDEFIRLEYAEGKCIWTEEGILAHIAGCISINKIQYVPNYSTWLHEHNQSHSSRA